MPARAGPGLQLETDLSLAAGREQKLVTRIVWLTVKPTVAEATRPRDPAYGAALRRLDAARSSLTEAADESNAALEALDDLYRGIMEARAVLGKRQA